MVRIDVANNIDTKLLETFINNHASKTYVGKVCWNNVNNEDRDQCSFDSFSRFVNKLDLLGHNPDENTMVYQHCNNDRSMQSL